MQSWVISLDLRVLCIVATHVVSVGAQGRGSGRNGKGDG